MGTHQNGGIYGRPLSQGKKGLGSIGLGVLEKESFVVFRCILLLQDDRDQAAIVMD